MADKSFRSPAVTVAVLCVGCAAYSLQQSLLAPALPQIEAELGITQTTASWLLTAYLLCASVATPIAGRLGDLFGKRRVLLWVLTILAVGTTICALASSAPVLLIGRVLQGASGGLFPLAYGIVRDELPAEDTAGGIGLISSLLGVGGGAGVVLAGLILEHLTYHWLFWLPLAVVLVALAATAAFVQPSPGRAGGRVEWRSAGLMSIGLVAVLVALGQTASWGWLSLPSVGLGGAGALVLAVWILRELRARHPLVDMRTMAARPVLAANAVALLVGAGMWSAFMLIPRFAQSAEGFGASVTGSGAFLLPLTAALLVIGSVAGRIERLHGSRPPLIAGVATCAIGLAILTVVRSEPWHVYACAALLGIGIGLAFAAITNIVVEGVSEDATGVATGVNTVMRLLGGAFGTQVAATLLAANLDAGGQPTGRGYAAAFALAALALLGALAAALLVPSRRALRTSADRSYARHGPETDAELT